MNRLTVMKASGIKLFPNTPISSNHCCTIGILLGIKLDKIHLFRAGSCEFPNVLIYAPVGNNELRNCARSHCQELSNFRNHLLKCDPSLSVMIGSRGPLGPDLHSKSPNIIKRHDTQRKVISAASLVPD